MRHTYLEFIDGDGEICGVRGYACDMSITLNYNQVLLSCITDYDLAERMLGLA